jgi:hypothetical protein
MDGPMTQLQAVHLAAGRLADDLVLLIDHIKPFLGHTCGGSDRTSGAATVDRHRIPDHRSFL